MNQDVEDDNLAENGGEEHDEGGCIGVEQDGYRHVVFGQIADGLIRPHCGPQEQTDSELTIAAMSDPDALEQDDEKHDQPTAWRWIFLLVLAVVSLAIVFGKK